MNEDTREELYLGDLHLNNMTYKYSDNMEGVPSRDASEGRTSSFCFLYLHMVSLLGREAWMRFKRRAP